MTSELAPLGRFLYPVRLVLLGLLLGLAVACELPTPTVEKPRSGTGGPRANDKGATAKEAPFVPPAVTAKLANVKLNWKDRQQTFELHLMNESSKPEIVHALVYARNETVEPPRRGLSPPTAFDWFNNAGRKDGLLTAADVERSWKMSGFQSGRGGTLRKTLDEKVDPKSTKVVEYHHDLDERSPHPQWKDRKLANVPYTDYEIWLFTPEGRCYFQDKWKVTGNPPVVTRVEPPPEPAQPPEKAETKQLSEMPPVVDTKPKESRPVNPTLETQAASELRLAQFYLDRKRMQEAREKLKMIIDKFPDTEAAKKAQELLKTRT